MIGVDVSVRQLVINSKRDLIGLGVCLAICFAAMGVGGWLTSSSVGSWYSEIAKPSWTPPGWVFGVVWPMLFTLMAFSAWLLWRASDGPNWAMAWFGLQLVLNVAWSGLFFGLRSPSLGLVGIVLLLGAIAGTVKATSYHSRSAALLLFPYVAWVSFASALNAEIWCMNNV